MQGKDATVSRVSTAELSVMVRKAYEACRREHMRCPWCTGYIGALRERHDHLCPWLHFLRYNNS